MNPTLNIKIRVLRGILLSQLKTNVQKQHTMKQNPNQIREEQLKPNFPTFKKMKQNKKWVKAIVSPLHNEENTLQ